MSVTVLLPAHNEQEQIAATIESLLAQTSPPERIVVIVNNTTDATAEVAARYPVHVEVLMDCPGRKAQAMNHGWSLGVATDYVLTMDSDTILATDAIEAMVASLDGDHGLGAVTVRYWALPPQKPSLVARLQRLEYARFDDIRGIRGWKVQVASGAAAMYRTEALNALMASEHAHGSPWDETSLIEDYALTLDLKALGYRVAAAPGAHALTDTPTTLADLWTQRLRWGRGGVDEVRRRGWTPATRRDIAAYGIYGFSLLMRATFLVWLVLMLLVMHLPYRFGLLGLIPLLLVWMDRWGSIASLPNPTLRDRLLVGIVLVEDVYGLFLESVTAVSICRSYAARAQGW